jgi:hypothetical protein
VIADLNGGSIGQRRKTVGETLGEICVCHACGNNGKWITLDKIWSLNITAEFGYMKINDNLFSS